MMFDEYTVKEFSKDLKKLGKYWSIEEDFSRFKRALEVDKEKLTGVERISGLGNKIKIPIYIAKKFYCEALGGGSKSGIRVVFAYIKSQEKVIFIEIYYKGKKKVEDRARILKYF